MKTKPTDVSVAKFIESLADATQQEDSKQLVKIMKTISGEPAKMWGSSIIGFGTFHYKYASGREGDWMKIGFSPRKGKISLYLTYDADQYKKELDEIGKHKTGKGCIYINRLSDVNVDKLQALIKKTYQQEV